MSHYVREGGPFAQACTDLLAEGFVISWRDRARDDAPGKTPGKGAYAQNTPARTAGSMPGRRQTWCCAVARVRWRWNRRAPEGQHTQDTDAPHARLVGHFKNTRAQGPAHVFSQRLLEGLGMPGTMATSLCEINHQSQSEQVLQDIPEGRTYPVRWGRVSPPKMLGEKGHGESERLLYEGERANRRSCRARHEGGWAKNPHSPPRETEPRGVDLRGRRRGRLWLTLRLVLRPLQRRLL